MNLFINAVPVLNFDMEVQYYYFKYYNAERPFISDQIYNCIEDNISPPILNIVNEIGTEAFSNNSPIFLPITTIMLLTGLETYKNLSKEKIIFLLDENIILEDIYIKKIKKYKSDGYSFGFKISSNNYQKFHSIIELMDFILINQKNISRKQSSNILALYPYAKRIATHVNTIQTFNITRATGYSAFEGKIYRTPLTLGQNTISPIKVNSIQLINLVQDTNFDINEVAKIIEKDTALAISLLNIVNSLKVDVTQEIKTLTQATALIGQKELRKWTLTAVCSSLMSDSPNEINKLSLVRARFSENLSKHFDLEKESESVFLMGLFSVLDVVLDVNIDEALSVLKVSKHIKDALINNSGPFYNIYKFVKDYESANWQEVCVSLILNKISASDVYDSYIESLKWYNKLLIAVKDSNKENSLDDNNINENISIN